MKLIKRLNTRLVHNKYMRRFGLFYCEYCNNIIEMDYYDGLKNKSCKCVQYDLISAAHKKHGDCCGNKMTRLYRIWCNMKKRCYNPKEKDAKYYKNKGIIVCDEWKNNYHIFRKWSLDNGYNENLTIDRIDNNKDYCPDNCQWLSLIQNTLKSHKFKLSWPKVHIIRQIIHNKLCTMKELAEIYNVTPTTIRSVVNNKIWKEEIIYNGI